MDYCISLKNVNKYFGGRHVVKDLSLKIKRGKITGFLGPNGSGKTTSMRIMCGLLRPDSGTGSCFNFDIQRQRKKIKPLIGFMTQNFTLWENLTVYENLMFLAKLHCVDNAVQRVSYLIDEFDLSCFKNVLTTHLSGGWKQRVSLAACMLHSPKIILLDEPTAGVDPYARREFWRILHNLSESGMTILVSTHYMDEAERCHELAWISYGKLLACGTANTIIQSQGLTTYAIRGPDLSGLECRLSVEQGIEQTAIYSNTLYITGKESKQIESSLTFLSDSYHIEKAATSLEDSFAHLMKKTTLI